MQSLGTMANSIRPISGGQTYETLYHWLNAPKHAARSVANDFPWDYITFDDPFYEHQFVAMVGERITFEEGYVPVPAGLAPLDFVPHEKRVPGEKYLEKCGHYHVWDPKLADWSLEDEVMKVMAEEIAREIDAEILEELLALANKSRSTSTD